MKLIYFFTLLLTTIACAPKHTENKQTAILEILDRAVVPKNIERFISEKLPGYSIPDSTDYIKSWWSFYERGTIPYYATTDINNDRKPDHAILLKSKKLLQLFILTDSANTFRIWKAQEPIQTFNDTINKLQYGLINEAPGRTDCVANGNEQSLVLVSNGFALMYFEFKDAIYYWDKGLIQSFKAR